MSSQLSRSFLKHKKKFNSNIKKFMYDLTIDNSFAQNNLLNLYSNNYLSKIKNNTLIEMR